MASAASKICFVVLFFLLSSPLSTPAAQQLLEKSTLAAQELPEKSPPVIQLKYTTKRLHRILVQLSSTLAQIINTDTAADDDVTKTVESVREVLSLISILESLLFIQSQVGGDLKSEMLLSTLSTLQSVLSSFDESSLPLQFKDSDDFSSLLKRSRYKSRSCERSSNYNTSQVAKALHLYLASALI